jgi:GNAT superfamily N-acetyltransferase
MYQVQNIDPTNADLYEKLTFPRFRELLREQNRASIVAGAVSCFGEPAGLVLAEVIEGGQTGKIHSLLVTPRFRGLGYGGELLGYAGERLGEKGCARLELSFIEDHSWSPAMKKILGRCGWSEPQLDREINKIDVFALAKEGWLHKYHLPPDYAVVPWPDIAPAGLAGLKEQENKWYRGFVSPFKEQPLSPHPTTSFWLCRREEIVGWVITRLTAPDTLYYDILFVREELQSTGRGVQLLAEALKAQFRQRIPFGTHMVLHSEGYANLPLIRFTQRRLKPFAVQTERYWNSYK